MLENLKFVLFIIIFYVYSAALGQAVFAADTLEISTEVSEKYISLTAVNYIIHLLPPDNTFAEIEGESEFGIESKKYNAKVTMFFQGMETFSYADSNFKKSLRYYKNADTGYALYKSGNVIVKYMKYISIVGNDTLVTWNAICGNDIFALILFAKYPVKYEEKLAFSMENLLKNIIFTPNPYIVPELNVLMDFDYSLLDLKFFQRSLAFSIFSEDGMPPPKLSKGTKFVILSSMPTTTSQSDNFVDQVVDIINRTFERYLPSHLEISKVNEAEVHQQRGVEIEGTFENNENLHFLVFVFPTVDRNHIILAFSQENEKEELFAKVRKMMETITFY